MPLSVVPSPTPEERLVKVETWIEGHEERCEERQVSLGREIKEMKGGIKELQKAAWGVALAVLGFCAVQIYNHLDRPAVPAPPALHASAQP